MEIKHSLIRCFAGIVAAAVAVSAFSGCANNSVSSKGNKSEVAVNSADELPSDYKGNLPTPDVSIDVDNEVVKPSYTYPTIWEVLPRVDETPASKFKYEYDAKLEGMVITDYLGKSPKIHIPDKIEGEPVVSANLGDIEVTHLIMPKTLINLTCYLSYIKYANYPNSNISFGHNNIFRFGASSTESKLETLYIEPDVKMITNELFSGCSNLTSVTIPNSVTAIGDKAFRGCASLTSVTIPDRVTYIGKEAFKNCSSLTSITIPEGVTSIDDKLFYCCSNLTSVSIPNSVTAIGDKAFRGCTSLTSVTIPDSVTSIGSHAFSDCSNLTSITIPDRVTISGGLFSNCSNLTSITYKGRTFGSPDELDYVDGYIVVDGVLQNCLKDYKGDLVIPSGVTSISDRAFAGCTDLTSVTIPSTVTSIGTETFKDCTSLTSITIPSNVTSIGSGTFEDCTGLTSVTIENGLNQIDENAFKGCSNLKTVEIADSVTEIDKSAFEGCNKISSVTYKGNTYTNIDDPIVFFNNIMNGLTIEEELFGTRTRLTILKSCGSGYIGELVIPEGVQIISPEAFVGCHSITSIVLPNSLIEIDINLLEDRDDVWVSPFYYCTNLNEIKYNGETYAYSRDPIEPPIYASENDHYPRSQKPENIEELCDRVKYPNGYVVRDGNFVKCPVYYSGEFVIPDGVEEISKTAFMECKKLTKIVIPNSVKVIQGGAFIGCEKLTEIVIPSSVKEIQWGAFRECTNLKTITIPEGVTEISEHVFSNCTSLTSIKLPDSVEEIQENSFEGCINLTNISYKGKTYTYETLIELYSAIIG